MKKRVLLLFIAIFCVLLSSCNGGVAEETTVPIPDTTAEPVEEYQLYILLLGKIMKPVHIIRACRIVDLCQTYANYFFIADHTVTVLNEWYTYNR